MRPVPIIITVVMIAGGAFAFAKITAPKEKGKTQYTLSPVTRGSVRKTVSATGTLKPWSTVDVKSQAGGRIDLLAVDLGSVVKKGDIIAKIDPTDSLLTFNQAKASTESANAKKAQSAETYQLTVQQADIAVQQAQANLASAKATLQQTKAQFHIAETESVAQPALTRASINQAKAAYDAAVQNRNKLTATQAQERATAQAAYDQAIANDRNAQANLERQNALLEKGFVAKSTVDTAIASAGVTKAAVDSAKSKLDTLDNQQKAERDSSDAAVAQALANYRSSQASQYVVTTKKDSLESMRGSVAQSEAAVQTAQAQLANAIAARRNGPIAQLDITNAAATVQSAQAQLVNAQTTLDQTVVRAPSDGVVLSKDVEQGTIITSGKSLNTSGTSIVTLGDISRMYVDVAVDETDIASIHLGGTVEIEFDAFPDRTFDGKVTKINPEGVVESNVTTIHVRVEVNNAREGFSDLKPEMNATCDFIESDAQDVLNVPSEAIQTEGNESYVEVATGGKPASGSAPAGGPPAGGPPAGGPPAGGEMPPMPAGAEMTMVDVKTERRKVEIGIIGNDSTEIKSGLQDGEMVVVSKQEPKTEQEAPKGALGGGFPGGGRR